MLFLIKRAWVKYLFANLVLTILPIVFYLLESELENYTWIIIISILGVTQFVASFARGKFDVLYNVLVLVAGNIQFFFYYDVVWRAGFDLFNIAYFILLTFLQVLLYSNLKYSYYGQVTNFCLPLSQIFLLQQQSFDRPYVWLFLDGSIKTIALFLTYFSIKTQELQKMLDYKSRYVNNIREEGEVLKEDLENSYKTLFKNKSKFQTKKLEWQQAVKLSENLQEESKYKNAFLEQINHAVRNSTNSTIGLVEILVGKSLDPESRMHLKSIKKGAYDLMKVLNSIMQFIEIEYKKLVMVNKPYSIEKLERSVNTYLSIESRKHKRNISLVIDDEIPKYMVYDFDKLASIMEKIVDALLQYTSDTEIRIRIAPRKQVGKKMNMRFSFEVDGEYFMEEDVDRILNKNFQFEQAIKTLKDKKEFNAEFNFIIVDRIISHYDSSIQFERGSNSSKVFFDLMLEVLEFAEQVKIEKEKRALRNQKFENQTVLLVEDNATNAMVAKLMIESLGMKTVIAENGQIALDTMLSGDHKIDLILMDIQMPVMNGIEATGLIRQQVDHHDMPVIIALTANNMETEDMHYNDLGFDDLIMKPIKKVKLVDKLEQHLFI